jgi:hypothetical protein
MTGALAPIDTVLRHMFHNSCHGSVGLVTESSEWVNQLPLAPDLLKSCSAHRWSTARGLHGLVASLFHNLGLRLSTTENFQLGVRLKTSFQPSYIFTSSMHLHTTLIVNCPKSNKAKVFELKICYLPEIQKKPPSLQTWTLWRNLQQITNPGCKPQELAKTQREIRQPCWNLKDRGHMT